MWKSIGKSIIELILFIPRLVIALKCAAVSFRGLLNFIAQGGIAVDTSFQHRFLFNPNRSFSFRTTIQPDADVINLLPNPNLFSSDDGYKSYERNYEIHRSNVERLLSNLSNGVNGIMILISGTISIPSSAALIKVFDWDASTMTPPLFIILTFLVRYLFPVKLIFKVVVIITKWLIRATGFADKTKEKLRGSQA